MSISSEPLSSDGTPIAMYAWHEAGHAIYAIANELGLTSVWIDQDHAPTNAPSHACAIQKPDSDELLAAYYVAGAAGECLLGRCDRYDIVAHSMNDYQPVLEIVAAKHLPKAEEIAWIRAREIDAEQILAAHRPAFDAVVRELLTKRGLSGDEVAEVMNRACAQ